MKRCLTPVKNFLLLVLAIAGLLLAGCSSVTPEYGTLEGKVTIGPITPVEQPGSPPPIPCNVYEARKVIIYDENDTNQMKVVDLDCGGTYLVELEPGVYIVDINHTGIDRSPDVPVKIEITAGETMEVNIDIDTGIR